MPPHYRGLVKVGATLIMPHTQDPWSTILLVSTKLIIMASTRKNIGNKMILSMIMTGLFALYKA